MPNTLNRAFIYDIAPDFQSDKTKMGRPLARKSARLYANGDLKTQAKHSATMAEKLIAYFLFFSRYVHITTTWKRCGPPPQNSHLQLSLLKNDFKDELKWAMDDGGVVSTSFNPFIFRLFF